MRKLFRLLPFAALLTCATLAHAARFSCANTPNLPNNVPLTGYNFNIQLAVSAGGSGAGVGKPTSSLSIQFPLDATYSQIADLVATGRHSSTCVLTDPISSAVHVEYTLTDVAFSQIQVLNGLSYNNSRTTSVVQMNVVYTSYKIVQ